MRVLVIAAFALVLSGCADGRYVGNVFDPVCAPDGSVVKYQYPNQQGAYEGAEASKENCPWN